MQQKQEALLTLKSIISESEGETINKEFLIEKLDACFGKIRPRVLLSQKGRVLFDKFARDLHKRGEIIYKPKEEKVEIADEIKDKLL